jgi:predicted DCC family thiol-disulfide oxidoreductase YuxK
MHSKLVVWYNTKCVCSGGIKWQQKRLVRAAQAGAIGFRDINLEPTLASVPGSRTCAAGCTGRMPKGAYS